MMIKITGFTGLMESLKLSKRGQTIISAGTKPDPCLNNYLLPRNIVFFAQNTVRAKTNVWLRDAVCVFWFLPT